MYTLPRYRSSEGQVVRGAWCVVLGFSSIVFFFFWGGGWMGEDGKDGRSIYIGSLEGNEKGGKMGNLDF